MVLESHNKSPCELRELSLKLGNTISEPGWRWIIYDIKWNKKLSTPEQHKGPNLRLSITFMQQQDHLLLPITHVQK